MKRSRQSRIGIIVGAFVFVGINFVLFQNCSGNVFRASEPVEFMQAPANQVSSNDQGSSLPPTKEAGPEVKDPEFICPAMMCAAPPDGCNYELAEGTKDSSGNLTSCPQNCGKLVCLPGTKPKYCPMIACAAEPEGCAYSGASITKDPDGCDATCGQLVCEEKAAFAGIEDQSIIPIIIKGGPKACPQVGFLCVLPAPNCRYDASTAYNDNGCQTGCGTLICESRD